MSVLGNSQLLMTPEGYQISRSVRLRSSASGYFNRTPASAGNRTTWTWSGWVKLGALVDETFVSLGTTLGVNLRYASGALQSNILTVGSTTSTAVYRDPSAWYHIVLAVDTTQASNNSRLRIYVNGSEVAYSANATITQNANLGANSTTLHTLGVDSRTGSAIAGTYFDGYLTEVNFIDGQALTPSSFGETDVLTGVWKPKKYAGTYGTNGFYLNFSDNSAATAAAIGKDYSGNGNNWTPNNISVTAGVTYDSMIDTPTPYADGGNGRGNYATLNPVSCRTAPTSLLNGNLSHTGSTDKIYQGSIATISGKFYFEHELTASSVGYPGIGVCDADAYNMTSQPGDDANSWGIWLYTGNVKNNSVTAYSLGAFAVGDKLMLAVDLDAGKVWFGKNNTWGNSGNPATGVNPAFSNLTGKLITPVLKQYSSGTFNFGAGSGFAYTPPTGFKALNTQNLPEPTIKKGNQHFDVSLWTGNGAASQAIVNSYGFQPDMLWFKWRNGAYGGPAIVDSVRGRNKSNITYATDAEYTSTAGNDIVSFNTNGFTVGGNQYYVTNQSGNLHVGWQWKAGGTAVTNTAGSITSTVSANTTSGFSVVTYTGTGANATVGHGLGVAPAMIIAKVRNDNGTRGWPIYHKAIPTLSLKLNTTAAGIAQDDFYAPNTSTISLTASSWVNGVGYNYVAYCFAEVAGYSKFGSYTGNGSADGPFVFCGFRPAYVMIKRTDTANDWAIHDKARIGYNVANYHLLANSSGAEFTDIPIDLLSNGFKLRGTSGTENASGGTYVYAAFAEHPFKNSLAR